MADWPLLDVQRYETTADAATSRAARAVTGVAHTKGAWVELIASTDVDSVWLAINMSHKADANIDDMLVDVAVGGAGSE